MKSGVMVPAFPAGTSRTPPSSPISRGQLSQNCCVAENTPRKVARLVRMFYLTVTGFRLVEARVLEVVSFTEFERNESVLVRVVGCNSTRWSVSLLSISYPPPYPEWTLDRGHCTDGPDVHSDAGPSFFSTMHPWPETVKTDRQLESAWHHSCSVVRIFSVAASKLLA
jgi:hypothetical protein